MEPESLRAATEWYNHIELSGLFAVGVLTASKLIGLLLERWLTPSCKDCSTIKNKQDEMRYEVIPELYRNIGGLDKKLAIIDTKLDLIMKGQRLVDEEEERERNRNPVKGQIK